MIWGREADDHIIKSAPFEMSVYEEDISADGLTAAGQVIRAVVDLPTIP